MEAEEKGKRPRSYKRSDNVIPDYEYLFEETADKKGRKKTKFLRKLARMNLFPLILSTFVYILQAAPLWAMPLVTADIINVVTASVSTAGEVTREVWNRIIIDSALLLFMLLQNIPTTMWRGHIVSKMLRTTSAGIKCSVIRKLQSLSITYHKDIQTGKIQSKFLKDTDAIDNFFNLIAFSIIPNVVSAIIAAIVSVCKNGIIGLFFLFVIPCNVGLTFAFRKTIVKRNHDYRVKTEGVSTKVTTMLEMMPVTKAHGLENKEYSSVESSIRNLAGSGRKMDMTNAGFGASSWVINMLLSAVCLVFCAVLALKKIIGVGDIVLYQSMFSSISGYAMGLVGVIPQVGSGAEALNSVAEIMNAKDVEVNIGKKNIPEIKGKVDFDNVYYRYPGTEQYVLQNFNLHVSPGECIAVVGASGSGKSTIMNLIIGLLTPTSGEIKIDDKPMSEFNLSEYRHFISVVPQNSILFSGSIRDNITYGLSGYTEEELRSAVEKANITEFLKDLPEGLDTDVGEHGGKLSGGQKQRITIARALIRNPKILILDEATSALDNISEYHVQKAISGSIRGRTTFIVAHRLSTIRDADRIVVIEGGVAVETGSYEELMAKKGKFYELKCLNDVNLKTAEEGLS